jgi:outer membrane receptor protein involved in Fe transport
VSNKSARIAVYAAVSVAIALLHPGAVLAAGDAAEDDTLAEVVVTAEKRESTVQKTSLSITAVSSQQLIEQGLSRLEDIAASTPGISMKQFSPGQTEYEMRGLPSTGGSSATVGLYLNDVPMAASANSFNGKAAIDPDLFDLQRVEVLRGPQGTLYGAGSMGGTIRLITAPPVLNKFEGSSQTSASDTEHGGLNWGQSAMINLPIKDDVLALRLVGTDKYNDGWIDRIVVNPFPIGPTGACGWPTCTRGDVRADSREVRRFQLGKAQRRTRNAPLSANRRAHHQPDGNVSGAAARWFSSGGCVSRHRCALNVLARG